MVNKKAQAVGALILAIIDLSEKRGGKQKVQKIVGKKIFYEGYPKGKWMVGNTAMIKLSIEKLNSLTEKIKKEL